MDKVPYMLALVRQPSLHGYDGILGQGSILEKLHAKYT